MSKVATAMILAAGRGERLRPLTDDIPKPLVEVGGQTLLERHIQRLRAAGIERIVINIAHLPDQIRQSVSLLDIRDTDILFSEEEPAGLETAGGIIHALPLLRDEQFLVVNADIWTDFDFSGLLQRPLANRLAHLVMVDVPDHARDADFFLDSQGCVNQDRRGSGLTFAGISLLHSRLFDGYAPGWLALRPVLESAICESLVGGEHFTGRWCDVGTLERLHWLREQLATGEQSEVP